MSSTLVLRLSSLLLSLAAATAFAGAQPRMHEALDALHRAKTSANPIADLQAAALALRHGAHNKAGYRVEAIPIVERAIAELNAGERVAADKSIDAAINKVEKAVGAGVR
jgi:isocitrate/isopropylmalate dehydrogenase